MRRTVAVALLVAATLPTCVPGEIDAQTAGAIPGPTVGGVNYAPQYDFSEFWAATDGKSFRVVFAGNPFPALPVEEVKQRLLPVMQANKPRPALTFTYDVPAELPRPDYRLVLVFDPANDLGSGPVCNGVTRFKPRAPGTSGRFYVYGVYCRNDLALSETTAWTQATGPDDPRLGPLFAELFLVLFTDQPMRRDRFVPFMRW
ncbi:MAG: hypothetical protein A3D94_12405 [Alphaproteobacteria bacterium RIFCSPHIGHO2_12_FULL_66_14]|jgi:hypothetical protein|nr:MAG: hypothetical protein A3D94_12405 [Alphaproteobacteria bacterium RIFCSPHIGHO2_12_FULL_66_14]